MADFEDDDRPKRSWRDIDKMRDSSTHRKEPRSTGSGGRKLENTQAYRAYKTQLNRLFDGGALPDALKAKLAEGDVGADAKAKKEAGRAIIDAAPADIRAQLSVFVDRFGFPQDEEVLAKLLDLSDESVVTECLTAIAKLKTEGTLKKANLFRAKIKTALLTIDEPEIQRLGKELLASL
jgi:hypothetical protein